MKEAVRNPDNGSICLIQQNGANLRKTIIKGKNESLLD